MRNASHSKYSHEYQQRWRDTWRNSGKFQGIHEFLQCSGIVSVELYKCAYSFKQHDRFNCSLKDYQSATQSKSELFTTVFPGICSQKAFRILERLFSRLFYEIFALKCLQTTTVRVRARDGQKRRRRLPFHRLPSHQRPTVRTGRTERRSTWSRY